MRDLQESKREGKFKGVGGEGTGPEGERGGKNEGKRVGGKGSENTLERLSFSWSAANGGLRDGGLSKSEDIGGKRPFSSVIWISQVLLAPSGKGRKRQKKGEKGRFPGRAARHPLSPHLLHPHFRQPNLVIPMM